MLQFLEEKRTSTVKSLTSRTASVSKILKSLQVQTDFFEVAVKCSKNPKHEYFGKDPAEIQQIWFAKGRAGAERGNFIDRYIQSVLSTKDITISAVSNDEETTSKCNQFLKFYNEFLSSMQFIGAEVKLTSKLGINGRLDAMFSYSNKVRRNNLLIVDWKNNDKIRTSNKYKKLLGPAKMFDDCEAVLFTLQTYLYKYILEEYGLKVSSTRVIQILSDHVVSHKPYFNYDKRFIEDVVDWYRQSA